MTEYPVGYGKDGHKAAERMARVFEVVGSKTDSELAKVLQVDKTSISEARVRGRIPADWLVKILYLRGVNPDWVQNGIDPKFLAPRVTKTKHVLTDEKGRLLLKGQLYF